MKIPALLFGLFWAAASFGQTSGFRILFVDDSPDGFGNAEYLASALDSLAYDYVYLDVAGTGNLPDSTTYADFDMVIWHTSTNGVGNYLWNGDDTDNAALAAYLDGGGILWLIGNDFLYDRYESTPYNFEDTDFAYKYLGIASYDLQSYGDDGGLGLPVAQPEATSPITNLNDLHWTFGTIWWADGVTPLTGVETVYHMGDNTYLFDGKPCGVLNATNGLSVLTYFFDLSFATPFAGMRDNVEAVVDYFQTSTRAGEHPNREGALQVRPNPFGEQLQFQWKDQQPATLQQLRLLDAQGKTVASLATQQWLAEGDIFTWNLPPGLPAGLYQWQALSTEGMLSGKALRR